MIQKQKKACNNLMNLSLRSYDKQALYSMIGSDIMIEVLLRLPLISLLQSRCVCKWWKNLISDPVFISEYSRRNPHRRVWGFFLQKFLMCEIYSKLEFITCKGETDSAPKPNLSFIEDDNGVRIQHSCNGILICSSFRCHEEDRKYYICIPATKQYKPLPKPDCNSVYSINIAYDPQVSPDHKVICICDSQLSTSQGCIKIYDSASGSWKIAENFPLASEDLMFNRGVYWNGALHWVGKGNFSVGFNVENENTFIMRMPPIPEGYSERRLAYFGKSGGHLFLIEIYGPNTTRFDVMEMKSDYSGWFVKYRVDLGSLVYSFPEMVRNDVQPLHRYMFTVLHLFDHQLGDRDGSYMVLHIPGRFILYNFEDGSFTSQVCSLDSSLGLWYSWESVYPYANYLSYI
ncbi:hypothetical protein K2173_010909 [Erythroxylum novogranatense]|uniref:F-box domain-containing protein n=1 Tax=Erythroxylum novogranatense TaxID=1862640 RepID=A0AAV8T199_9ROSI|nr:hypothetical protein K2173_010909 [Erythroxylum novogranatense]